MCIHFVASNVWRLESYTNWTDIKLNVTDPQLHPLKVIIQLKKNIIKILYTRQQALSAFLRA